MLDVIVLASGSSGNALLVRSGGCAILVDAGLSARKLCAKIEACGIDPGSLAGILLTHEHGDHARGLKVLLSKHRVPVYATPLTADHLRRAGVEAEWNLFGNEAAFELAAFEVVSFPVPHDAADPVGFVVRAEGRSFGVLTDLGHATRRVIESVRGVSGMLVETNHDEDMLRNDTRRPPSVKHRILSRHGHLSNAAAAALVAEVATIALSHVVLGHLSRDCNSPELAVSTVSGGLREKGHGRVEVRCAPPADDAPVTRIEIR